MTIRLRRLKIAVLWRQVHITVDVIVNDGFAMPPDPATQNCIAGCGCHPSAPWCCHDAIDHRPPSSQTSAFSFLLASLSFPFLLSLLQPRPCIGHCTLISCCFGAAAVLGMRTSSSPLFTCRAARSMMSAGCLSATRVIAPASAQGRTCTVGAPLRQVPWRRVGEATVQTPAREQRISRQLVLAGDERLVSERIKA